MNALGLRNSLDAAFERGREENRALLIPYLTAGFPDPEGYVDLAVAVLEAGADALEIGVPFSDPLLDGPAIQHSQQVALEAGITLSICLRFAGEVHARSAKPLLFMGAYNPILAYGLLRFCRDAAGAGVCAVIVPDLPFEEQGGIAGPARDNGLHLIQLVAPTSTDDRLERLCSAASGFVYCISVAGVTGARASVIDTAGPLVDRVRAHTDLPVAVGFGISTAESAGKVARFAEGIIVGSALITLVGSARPEDRLAATREFIAGLATAVRRAEVGE